jgi:hypothetical protein
MSLADAIKKQLEAKKQQQNPQNKVDRDPSSVAAAPQMKAQSTKKTNNQRRRMGV